MRYVGLITSLLILAFCQQSLVLASGSARRSHLPSVPISVRVSHDAYLAHSEPAVAENPRNPADLVAASKFFSSPKRYRFKIGYYYSSNGGQLWHDMGLLPGFAQYQSVSDISLAFDRQGVVYACVLADGRPGSGIFVSRSTDGGRTFSLPVAVYLDRTGKTFSDKPWLAVDTTRLATAGNVYVAWDLDSNTVARGSQGHRGWQNEESGPPNPHLAQQIVFSRSIDGGRTFSSPMRISGPNQGQVLGAVPAVGPDGSISVIYAPFNNQGVALSIDVVRSTDGGSTFGPPVLAQTVVGLPYHLPYGTFRNFTLPALATSPVTGAEYIVWSDYGQGQADILFSESTNQGKTWSIPLKVNDDPERDGADHFMPAIAVAPDGVITVSWFDRRRDPSDRRIDTYLAQSIDGGRAFLPNRRVTRRNWNPAIDAPQPEGKPSDTFIGDYQALCVDNRFVHPLWNATVNGRSQEIYTARLVSSQ